MLKDKLNITKCSRTSQFTMALAVVVLTTIIAYNWVLSPQTGYLHAAQQYQRMMDSSGKKGFMIASQIKIGTKKIDKLNDQIAYLEKYCFTKDGAEDFFMNLETLSVECGCAIKQLTFIPELKSANAARQQGPAYAITRSASLLIVGDYRSIVHFLGKLNEYQQAVAVRSFHIRPIGTQSVNLNCSIIITICVLDDTEAESNGKD